MPRVTNNKTHALVHTMTIDVAVMRIGKKQVTQSVFRQLKEESIFELENGAAGRIPFDNPHDLRVSAQAADAGSNFHVDEIIDKAEQCAVDPDEYDTWVGLVEKMLRVGQIVTRLRLAGLKGTPWGIVRYQFKQNGKDTAAEHLVWQKGNELRRIQMNYDRLVGCVPIWPEEKEDIKDQLDQWLEELDQLFIAV